ncbi:ribose-phosphate diphosphokinase [Archaeoglobus neptunius]|uniref:ribose-phosphate diphosphokinase n=1 Tax=Archaeoglobus neptunius TaxID=2798580 RepID=UPI0019274885|nr:ribose-phosphate diphosphokinase [Archaeoglobus neptunius]
MPLLVAGTNGVMALKIAKLTGYPICYSQIDRYPDGEKYFRFACDVEGEDIIIFNSMHPNPDEILFETILIADTAYQSGARTVSCVFPYFAYARTVERGKGEALPITTVVKMLKNADIRKVYTVDFHLQKNVFGVEHIDLTGMDRLAEYCMEEFSDSLTVIAPDEKATFWANKFAEKFGGEVIALKKIRIDAENVIVDPISLKLEGDVVIVDDIISTAGTVCQAARIARKAGCRKVFAACTHAIMAGDAMMRLLESGIEDVVATDTIPSPISHVSVAETIASALNF